MRVLAIPPDDEQCRAVLKSVTNWRCKRHVVGQTELCAQHRYFGAKIPELWLDQASPIGPFRHWPGTRRTAA